MLNAVVIVPPVSVIGPEADPKFILAAETVPERLTVPEARPVLLVPKYRTSEVVEVMLVPSVASVPPVAFPDHRVLPPELQVPPAEPKPEVVPLLSQ